MAIKLVCSVCKKEPSINKKLSNKNWNVIDNKPCQYCGGKLIPQIYDSRRRK